MEVPRANGHARSGRRARGGGASYEPASVADTHHPGGDWILRLDTQGVPEAAYDLVADGVTRGGARVVVPPIHFTPAVASSPFGP